LADSARRPHWMVQPVALILVFHGLSSPDFPKDLAIDNTLEKIEGGHLFTFFKNFHCQAHLVF